MNNDSHQRAPGRASRRPLQRSPHSHRRAAMAGAVAAAIGFIPSVAYGYVDPGAAGFLITTILGSIAAAGYLARQYIARVKRWLSGEKQPELTEPTNPPEDAEDNRGDDRGNKRGDDREDDRNARH